MGLNKYELVWYQQSGEGEWVARLETPDKDVSPKTIRFAHVGIYNWSFRPIKNKVLAEVLLLRPYEHHYADSVEDAKIWVEAVFALLD